MSDRDGVRAFVLALVLTILLGGIAPLVLVAARFAAIGEFDVFESDAALAAQRLYGPFDLPTHRYKFRMTMIERPRLLLLGSSNVLTFRRSLFTECASRTCFYNAGGGMPTTRVGADLVRELIAAGAEPDVLLLGLDMWEFNPNYEENTHPPTRLTSTVEDRLRLILGVTRAFAPRVLTDADLRELVLGLREAPPGHRGARALLRSEGYRDDGSYSFGAQSDARVLRESPAERSADVVDRIARGCCRFQRFTDVDRRSVDELEDLLGAASRAGVKVIAFNVPLSEAVMDAIDREPVQRAAFSEVERVLRAVTARHGVPFVWTARPADAGCTPLQMIDAFHPSEVCSARIVQRLLSDPESAAVLRPFVDPAALAQKLAHPRSDLSLDRE